MELKDLSVYQKSILDILNKALKDELSVSIGYIKQAAILKGIAGTEVQEVLIANGKEEFEHFTEIVSFATKFGLNDHLIFDVDLKVANTIESELSDIYRLNHKLEDEAIADYKRGAQLALDEGDFETHQFFLELAADEQAHFDSVAQYSGKTRELGKTMKTSVSALREELKKFESTTSTGLPLTNEEVAAFDAPAVSKELAVLVCPKCGGTDVTCEGDECKCENVECGYVGSFAEFDTLEPECDTSNKA